MEAPTQITATSCTSKSDSNSDILFHLQTTLSLPTTTICLSGHDLIRPYHPSDALTLSRLANKPLIAARLRDRFLSPYTLSDTEYFLWRASTRVPPLNFALCLVDNGAHVGGISLMPGVNVEPHFIRGYPVASLLKSVCSGSLFPTLASEGSEEALQGTNISPNERS